MEALGSPDPSGVDGAYKALESPRFFFLLTLAAVAFQFCRIGDDQGAMDMLEHLDDCEEVGDYVDCLPRVYSPGNTVLLVLLHH